MTTTGCPACDERIGEAAASNQAHAVTSWQCPRCGARVALVDQRSEQHPDRTDSKE